MGTHPAHMGGFASLQQRRKPPRIGRLGLFLTVTLIFIFLLFPVLFVVWISFFDSVFLSFPPPGYTLRWFEQAFNQPNFVNGFITSIEVAFIATVIGVITAIGAGLTLTRRTFPGRAILNIFLVSPLIVPGIVIGTALFIFYIQIDELFHFDPSKGISGLVLAHVALTIPWSLRLICANLQGMNTSVEEAALNLGASPWKTFFRVTLPLMRPGIVAAALFSFIISFENLEVSLLIVGPGNTTFPIALMQYLEFNIDPTVAAASTVQILIIGIALVISDRFVKLSRIV